MPDADQHKSELTMLLNELMADIDLKPLYPNNKILLYNQYVLPKLAWHFTVTNLSKPWIVQNLDSVAISYSSHPPKPAKMVYVNFIRLLLLPET